MPSFRSRKYKGDRGYRRIRDLIATIVLLAALAGLVHLFATGSREQLRGSVVVQDGDSLRMGEKRLRLSGIDAPELAQTCGAPGAPTPCGRRAREHLVALIAGEMVICSGSRQDRYGRLLAGCEAGGLSLNRAMVRDGWAVSFDDFAAEEDEARKARRGLWSGEFVPPSDWRRSHERSGEPKAGRDFAPGAVIENWIRRAWEWLRR